MTRCIVCRKVIYEPHGKTCSEKCSQKYSTEVIFIWTPWQVPKGTGLRFFDILKHNEDRRYWEP